MRSVGSRLFRGRALRRGEVREALDERARIVGIPRWIALALALLVATGLLAAAASSHVQRTVDGEGIFAPGRVVDAPVAGTVTRAPQPGDEVRAGDTVARIEPGQGDPVAVTAFAAGTIASVSAAPGTVVSPGQDLATLEPARRVDEAFLFVSLDDSREVEPGMEVLLSPRVEESQATGLLRGSVQEVGTYPASPGRIGLLLGPGLAPSIEAGPPVIEVRVRLMRDPSTPSGYAWTTGDGPPEPLSFNTPIDGRIVLSEDSPLSYVL